ARTIALGTSTIAGGVWADRLPRRAVMVSADLLRFGTEAVTAVLLLEGTAQVWHLVVLQSAAGIGVGFFTPASTALVPQCVSAGNLQKANALLSTSENGTRIFGPVVSGAIVVAAGPGWCLARYRSEVCSAGLSPTGFGLSTRWRARSRSGRCAPCSRSRSSGRSRCRW